MKEQFATLFPPSLAQMCTKIALNPLTDSATSNQAFELRSEYFALWTREAFVRNYMEADQVRAELIAFEDRLAGFLASKQMFLM